MQDKTLPPDPEALQTVAQLLNSERHAALAFVLEGGHPMVTRIAFGRAPDGAPISLVSDLSAHTKALRNNAACSLLIGTPGPKGDPLTHPRLTLLGSARFVDRDSDSHAELAAHYLRDHPKSKLYLGFSDFSFIRFSIQSGHLVGGFAKAYKLNPTQIGVNHPYGSGQ